MSKRLLTKICLFVLITTTVTHAAPVRLATVASLEGLGEAWSQNSGLEVSIEISDRETAIRMVAGEKADYALIPGELTSSHSALLAGQLGRRAIVEPVGWSAVTFIVHPENPLPAIDHRLATLLLSATDCPEVTQTVSDWQDVHGGSIDLAGPIELVAPARGSWRWRSIEAMCLKGCNLRGDTLTYSSEAAVERRVTRERTALGLVQRPRYIGLARMLPVWGADNRQATVPSSQSLADGAYPFGRRIVLLSNRRFASYTPQGKFRDYALSASGQRDVARLGLYSLR